MKTNYDKYCDYCDGNKMEQEEFYQGIMDLFNVSYGTAMNLWYAPQRSWFKEEMFDELIRLDKVKDEFIPNLCSGEFEWEGNKFIPDKQ